MGSELIFIVMAFVVFSLVGNLIDHLRRRTQEREQPPPEAPPDFEIPPVRRAPAEERHEEPPAEQSLPPAKSARQIAYEEYLARADAPPGDEGRMAADAPPRRKADYEDGRLHKEILMTGAVINAIMVAEALNTPKGYLYMERHMKRRREIERR